MTVEMAAYLVYVAGTCNYIFMHVQTKGRYLSSPLTLFSISFWISVHLTRLFSLNYICEKISAKVNIHINFNDEYMIVCARACIYIFCESVC